MMNVLIHIIMDKSNHTDFLTRLRAISEQYHMVRSVYECQTYWKMSDKYDVGIELTFDSFIPFAEWESIYAILFRQPYSVEFFYVNNTPFCNLVYHTPCREDGEPMPEKYFVEFCIPESAISDIDVRFPNRIR